MKTLKAIKIIKVYSRKTFIEKKSDLLRTGFVDIVKSASIFNNGDVIGEYVLFSNNVKICYYTSKSFTVTEKTEKKTEDKKPTKKEVELKKCNDTLLPLSSYGFEGVNIVGKKVDVVTDTIKKCIDIIDNFSKKHVKGVDTDYDDLKDYLINDFYNNYLKLCDSGIEVNEKTIYNALWHSIKLLKLRYNNINYMTKNDKTVTEKNKIGGGVDSGEYDRIVKSKHTIDRNNCVSYLDIADCFTNKSTRNATLHGCFYVSVYSPDLRNTLTSGLLTEDLLRQKAITKKVLEVLQPMFDNILFPRFKDIIMSDKKQSNTDKQFLFRFRSKYPFLKEIEKNDLIYLINTYYKA